MPGRRSLTLLSLLSLASLSSVAAATEPAHMTKTAAPAPVELSLQGKAGKLPAWLWRPSGPGPLPVIRR